MFYFVVQYTTKIKDLVPFAQAYQRFPLMVIEYFEERLSWRYENSTNKLQHLKEEEVRRMRERTNNFKGGIAKNYIPEAICGIINTTEGLLILIKWKYHDIVELIPVGDIHTYCPEMLLSYYNERIDWNDPTIKDILCSTN